MITATPARHGTLPLDDGRTLAYAEFGVPDGRPVILFHGNPGSRLICPDADATAAAGIHLITFDRPGFGGSDPLPMHRVIDVGDDVAALAHTLGLEQIGVIGWSGGGPYALGMAARHPDIVTTVTVVSGSGLADDPDLASRMTPETAALLEGLRDGSVDALRDVEARFAAYVEDAAYIVKLTLANEDDPDRRLMTVPEIRQALTAMWEEGARQGATGVAAGWAALWALPWGFELHEIAHPVHMWHGSGDVIVPLPQAERVAQALRQATIQTFPG